MVWSNINIIISITAQDSDADQRKGTSGCQRLFEIIDVRALKFSSDIVENVVETGKRY